LEIIKIFVPIKGKVEARCRTDLENLDQYF
jgi:hypothetical protein